MKHFGAAGIWDDNRAAKTFSTSGYQKLPSGLIIQWGQAAPTSGTATVTFPIPFPTACGSITSTPIVSGVATTSGHSSFLLTMSVTGCTIAVRTYGALSTGASTAPVLWQAIGY